MTDYRPLQVRLVNEGGEGFRERLIAVLEMQDLGEMIITLRSGKQIILGDDEENPRGRPIDVRVGRDYLEVNIAPGAGAAYIYEMALFSEISNVWYF